VEVDETDVEVVRRALDALICNPMCHEETRRAYQRAREKIVGERLDNAATRYLSGDGQRP
jgi:hypothetical protein